MGGREDNKSRPCVFAMLKYLDDMFKQWIWSDKPAAEVKEQWCSDHQDASLKIFKK